MSYDDHDVGNALALLDELAEEIARSVRVAGPVDVEDVTAIVNRDEKGRSLGATISASPSVGLGGTKMEGAEQTTSHRVQRSGVELHRVHFGSITQLLTRILSALPISSMWVLLDEWSSVPLELQPLLGDLLRRAILPVRGIVVKIAAIEQRSEFRIALENGELVGIEVGADAAANVDLDDFLVFNNDAGRAKAFFASLLFRHVVTIMVADGDGDVTPATPEELVRRAFTQADTFEEFVRAAEGVPRDALNIIAKAAMAADDNVVTIKNIRTAARGWYEQDKATAMAMNEEARDLLTWIMSEVIGERQARAFLLEVGDDRRHPLIRALYDARVLHLVRRSIAARDQPGVRFNGWALDYGCYVDLVTTVTAPRGEYAVENEDGEETWVDVPNDDYRSTRRAVLDLDRFDARQGKLFRPPIA